MKNTPLKIFVYYKTITVLFLVLLYGTSAFADMLDLAGEWQTPALRLVLRQSDDKLTGFFQSKNSNEEWGVEGRIDKKGNVFLHYMFPESEHDNTPPSPPTGLTVLKQKRESDLPITPKDNKPLDRVKTLIQDSELVVQHFIKNKPMVEFEYKAQQDVLKGHYTTIYGAINNVTGKTIDVEEARVFQLYRVPPPALSYSYPSYKMTDYDGYITVINKLIAFGYQWITFTPAFMVTENGTRLKIDISRTPIDKLEQAVEYAAENGLHVKLQPHLDWKSTLDSDKEEDWRQRMYFNPDTAGDLTPYGQTVIESMLEIIIKAASSHPDSCFALTLGSELAVSLVEFSTGKESWSSLIDRMKGLRSINVGGDTDRLSFGHKLNHDTLGWGNEIRERLNAERKKRNLSAVSSNTYKRQQKEVAKYLGQLEFVSFSFYPFVLFKSGDGKLLRKNWWYAKTKNEELATISDSFAIAANKIAMQLKSNAEVQFNIGEFGLGTTDPNESYKVHPEKFLDSKGQMQKGPKEMRRKFYLGFLQFLREHASMFSGNQENNCHQAITFWTTGHFDILNVLGYGTRQSAFIDNVLIDNIRKYNKLTAFSNQ